MTVTDEKGAREALQSVKEKQVADCKKKRERVIQAMQAGIFRP